MRIARSIASKVNTLPGKMLCVLIVLTLLGPAAPILAREPINVDGGSPAAQHSQLTEQLAASHPTPPAAPVTAAAQPSVALQDFYLYLPLVSRSGQPGPSPASPYAAALSQALADCAGTKLNQVCYARGSVTLNGGGPLTTPGQVATLDGVSGLTLVSPDAGHWSVALLRLAADSPTPDLGLTLLAFGNVRIRNLTLFHAAAGNGDVAPALSFSSSPVPGQDPETGGIIVYNPNHQEPLSISLNGADLTLASSAVVQAQPGVKMSVTMATGSALVSTAAGDGAVIQGQQLSVPLDGSGAAAGAPTAPIVIPDSLLKPIAATLDDDLLVPLVPPLLVDLEEELKDFQGKFDSAYARCMAGDSRQVYRVMYYARILKMNEAHLPDGMLSLIDVQVSRCATFEIEFNSVISGTSTIAWGSMYIQGQGMIVSYDMYGRLVQPAEMPLTHVRYDFGFMPLYPGCTYPLVLEDGALYLTESTMRINHNRLDISTKVDSQQPEELFKLSCPGGGSADVLTPAYWFLMFRDLHMSETDDYGNTYLFTPAHWKYTGNRILAEAIFSRQATFWDGVSTGDTWLVMLHKPGR